MAQDFDRQAAEFPARVAAPSGFTALGAAVTGAAGQILTGKGEQRRSADLGNDATSASTASVAPTGRGCPTATSIPPTPLRLGGDRTGAGRGPGPMTVACLPVNRPTAAARARGVAEVEPEPEPEALTA